ncbi:glutamate receptor ionotropic, delta-2-like [Panulirus ornatus]|uniref:glutamate receptor ionotropic, delta-2-like n=1 Tax=Panulirus ornatus TaxID=150431 RepID=UPI003A8A489C
MAVEKPFIMVTGDEWMPFGKWEIMDNGERRLTGPLMELLDVLRRYMEFEYELFSPPDRGWGIMRGNGSWTGMIGHIQRKEAEIALGPFAMTPQRSSVCDFSIPLVHESFAILTPRPRLESDVSGFLKPFAAQVWLLILASLLSVGTAMACVVWAEGKIFRVITRNIVSKASTWVLLTLSQEGSEWLPKEDGGRLIVTTWLLASLVFMTSYSGILTAMLTLPRVVITIDSLPDLVSQSALPWHIQSGSALLPYLRDSEDETHQQAYRGRGADIQDCMWSLQDISDGKFAAFCSVLTIWKAMDLDYSTTGQCHLYGTREKVMSNAIMSLAFSKNSTYLAKANYLLRVLLESGLWNKWLKDELTNSSHCLRHPSLDGREGIQPLDMKAFTGPLYFLLGGAMFGMVVFLCEYVSQYILKPSQTTA